MGSYQQQRVLSRGECSHGLHAESMFRQSTKGRVKGSIRAPALGLLNIPQGALDLISYQLYRSKIEFKWHSRISRSVCGVQHVRDCENEFCVPKEWYIKKDACTHTVYS
jgi:hypothetical protein